VNQNVRDIEKIVEVVATQFGIPNAIEASKMVFRWICALCLLSVLVWAGGSFATGLELEVELVLGSEEDNEEYFIGAATSVVESSTGHIFISDYKQMKVLRFTGAGDFLGYFGKTGDGPADLMPRFNLAIDQEDRLYLVGQGRRVEVVDLDWNHIESFDRENPVYFASGLSVLPSGNVVISSPNTSNQTVLTLYDQSRSCIRSFSNTFAVETDFPRQHERSFAGGMAAVGSSGAIFYVQRAPYEVRKFSSSGELVQSTSVGGEAFVDPPRKPEVVGDRVTYYSNSSANGIISLAGGGLLVTAIRSTEEGSRTSLVCLYQEDLTLVGSVVVEGIMAVIGRSAGGGAYFLRQSETGYEVVRTNVRIANP